MRKKLTTILYCIAICCAAQAQHPQSGTMRLSRTSSGHYAFSALLNNKVLASVMIESGIHAMLIDSAYYFSHRQELGITIHPIDRKRMNGTTNLGGNIYRITHLGKGKLPMGGITYEGDILILANYRNDTPVTIPIHQLRNPREWYTRIVMLNIAGGEMRMLTHRELREWQGERYKMNRSTYRRMPAIRTTIRFTNDGTTAELEGNFNIDLGNPMLLYLLGNRPKVSGLFEMHDRLPLSSLGYNANGKASMQIFTPEQCDILGESFSEPIVCVTHEFRQFTSEGLIGIGFLARNIVAFDFNNNYLYIKE